MDSQTDEILNKLLDRQKQAWIEGRRPAAEDSLRGTPLQNDTEVLLDLIYNEILIREELGEQPTLEEYISRYPSLSDDIKLHFEVHSAIQNEAVGATRRLTDDGWSSDEESFTVNVGPTLRDYEVIAELGRGGMGVVYRARHRLLNRMVAVKMIMPGRFPSPRELSRFQREAEAVARLQHPNIVQIFEVGQANKSPYIALELADHGTLAQKLQNLPLGARPAAELIETLARAIQHAHDRDIIHRDLKPANILFTRDDTPKITDFGLAKILQDDAADATRTGEPLGTPRYMSPEQASGHANEVGPATDIYALGTILYECLTGQVPFVATTVLDTMEKIRRDEPVAPRRVQPSIPRDLETICLNCLHKNPARRYSTALDLADDLRRFLNREPIYARRTTLVERGYLWCRRRPALAGLIAVCLTVFVSGALALGMQSVRESRRLANLRESVMELMSEGERAMAEGRQGLKERHAAVAEEKFGVAKGKFDRAWQIVMAEPALHELVFGVHGWMQDEWQASNRMTERRRKGPPRFAELLDEAVLQIVFIDPNDDGEVRIAREAIEMALDRAANQPETQVGRDRLELLSIDLDWRAGDAAGALDRLKYVDVESPRIKRLKNLRIAEYLDRLGQKAKADEHRALAAEFPPEPATERLLSALDHFRRLEYQLASRDFDAVLWIEPDLLLARTLQSVCYLELKRPHEAKVGLTACLEQNKEFDWAYLLRGKANQQLGDVTAAERDFKDAREKRRDPQRDVPNFASLANLGLRADADRRKAAGVSEEK